MCSLAREEGTYTGFFFPFTKPKMKQEEKYWAPPPKALHLCQRTWGRAGLVSFRKSHLQKTKAEQISQSASANVLCDAEDWSFHSSLHFMKIMEKALARSIAASATGNLASGFVETYWQLQQQEKQ